MRTTRFIGVEVGEFTICLHKIKKVFGHDDTLPFNAEFEVSKNGEVVVAGNCWNTGWGGDCEYQLTKGSSKDMSQVNSACQEKFFFKFNNRIIRYSILIIFDILAERYIFKKSNKTHLYTEEEFQKTIKC